MAHVDLRDQALAFHRRLPKRLWRYLRMRGIPNELIHRHLLGWDGARITIPIPDRDRRFVFFKRAKDPEDRKPAPKMLTGCGSRMELYGWDVVRAGPRQVVICEGEFDRLVLETQGFPAVTSTAGAGSFSPDWVPAFADIPEVYVCFDRDEAGRRGAERIVRLLPHARVIALPKEVGDGGDVTDFFVRLGKRRGAFTALMDRAQTIVPMPDARAVVPRTETYSAKQITRLKECVPIEMVIGQYVALQGSGTTRMGLCPFHDDHRPSLGVFPATGTFHCFACGVGGDVITFLQEKERLSFQEALRVLERLA